MQKSVLRSTYDFAVTQGKDSYHCCSSGVRSVRGRLTQNRSKPQHLAQVERQTQKLLSWTLDVLQSEDVLWVGFFSVLFRAFPCFS